MTLHSDIRGHVVSAAPRRRPWLDRLLSLVALQRQRSRLAELDEHLLRDIGLDRDTARREAARPFWDAPPHWFQ